MSSAPCRADWMISAILMWNDLYPAASLVLQGRSLVTDTGIVSGNISRGNGSPDGIFKIAYKQKDATLVGENYASDVRYFMPFATMSASTMQAGAAHLAKRSTKLPVLTAVSMCLRKRQKNCFRLYRSALR